MKENTSSNKISRLALGLVILVALAGVITVGITYRHSHRLQVRLDGTTKELQQTRSELEQIKSASKQTAIQLAKVEPRPATSIETAPAAEQARLSKELFETEAALAEMRLVFTEEHPKVQLMVKRVETLQKLQQNTK